MTMIKRLIQSIAVGAIPFITANAHSLSFEAVFVIQTIVPPSGNEIIQLLNGSISNGMTSHTRSKGQWKWRSDRKLCNCLYPALAAAETCFSNSLCLES